jgi:thiol-disulfide isomerase/thioredoxin
MGSFKRISYASSLIAVVVLATSFVVCSNALGAEHPVGSGNDTWWTTYPDRSPGSGSEVKHPSWVLDALKNKPVVVYVHLGCSYCRPQTDAMAEVVKEYGDKFTYYDISADGSDARSEPALRAYDPNGNATLVPMTIIVTLAPDSSGKVQVVWHSTEEVTGKAWIEDYVLEAIDYYEANSANWKK